MRVLVTGATGFVGRHVIPHLLENGCSVTAVSRDERKARSFSWFNSVRFVASDIHGACGNTFEQFGQPEVALHLAWPGLPNYKSRFHLDENLPADYGFLRSLVDAGISRLLVTGTCLEYGMQSGPLKEDMETRPANPYSLAKDTLRLQIQRLQTQKSFAFTWARLFYLYGDGQADTSLLPQLKGAVRRGDPVFNMSGGEQLRDYLPVAEAAKCLVSLALRHEGSGVVNVCSGAPISVRALVENWIRENDWSINLNLGHYPYVDYEPMAFWGDRQKLVSCLGSD